MSRPRQHVGGLRNIAQRVGIAFRALTGGGSALPPWDDYWYSRPGWDSAAGMAVTPETAMKLSAVFACVRVRSESLATCPLVVFKRLPNGGKVRATEHPLYQVLHNSPNQWQTSVEFIEMMQAHLDLRGNAFARIVPGPRGAIDQLIPLHPDLVQVYRLPNGKLKYQIRSRFTAEVDWYMQEEIFHLRGLTSDGLVGLSPIAVQRETIGTALGMQDYAARFFANDATTSTWIKHPGRFKDDAARDKFRENWQKSQTGENRHRTAVLEEGLELKQIGLSNKDSQFLEANVNSREEVCAIYRVPPHKIAILQRATNNNIEHQGIEFVTDAIQPAATRWERRVNVDLIDPISAALDDGAEYFAEFIVGGLLRGDMKSRYDAYAIGRNWGWLCPDTICEFEGMNPLPEGKGGQEYLRPLNMVPSGTVYLPSMATDVPDPQDKPAPDKNQPAEDPPPDTPDDEGQDARQPSGNLLRAFATEAARRVVRKEVTALRKTLTRSAKQFDATAFATEAQAFYTAHVALVAQTMCISPAAAKRYAENNLKLLVGVDEPEEKSCALDWIEDTAPDALATLALGTKKAATPALRS
jgi:HK97 family phage portal protein